MISNKQLNKSQPGGLKILSEDEIEQVHSTALKILKDVGVFFHHPGAQKVLAEAGCEIRDGEIVRIPSGLVEDALGKAPPEFSLFTRDMDQQITWGGSNIHFGAGGSAIRFLDRDSGTARAPKTKDLLEIYQLADTLSEISWLAPGLIVEDVPQEVTGIWRFYLRLKFGSKPSCPDGISVEDLLDNLALLREVRESEELIRKKPFGFVQACSTPPLTWSKDGAGFILEAARANLPVALMPMPSCGAGAPATLAGAIAQQEAEALSGIVLTECISPGNPCLYSGAPSYMDMRYGSTSFSSIEAVLIHLANTQVGKYLNLPTSTGDCIGHSDSKLIDFQAGAESAMSQFLVSLGKNNGPCGLGFLESQRTYSLEKLIVDHEICTFVKRFLRGVGVSEETLALDVFNEVGPQGDFLKLEHTLKWFKEEYLFPRIFDRRGRESWEAKGGKDTLAKAGDEVVKTLADSSLHELPPSLDQRLDEKMDAILNRRGYSLSDLKQVSDYQEFANE